MPNNGEDDRPLFEQEDLQRHVLEGEFQGVGEYEDRVQQDDGVESGSGSSVEGDATITPQELTTAIQDLAVPHELGLNVNRGGGVHGRAVKSPANHHHHHLKLQGHMHNARRHPHPYAARDVDGVLDERQYSTTTILSNDDQYSPSTTAPPSELVDTASSIATTTATPHTSDSSSTSSSYRDTSIQERGSAYEEGSPPSSPVSRDLVPPIISTITLSNTSPILTTISPTPPTTPTTTSRRNPKVNRPHSPTTTTSTRLRRPTSTSSTSSRRRTSRPTPTRTRTRAPSTSNNAQITPPSLSFLITSTPRISNVVHICIVRLPVTEQGGPPPALVTFTSTAHFPNGIPTIARSGRRLPTPSTRINTRSREEAGLSDNSRGGLGGGDTEEEAPALTVTDYHCQLTLPALSRLLHTPTSSPNPTLSPSDGLNVDDSTLPNLGPAAADPTSGDGTHRDNDNGTAFFATPGGKGTIAGISIASAILISFVLFFLWRKKKDTGDEYTGHTVGGGNRGSAASSFGDSSDGQFPPLSSDLLSSPPDMAMMDQQPQMQEIGTGTGPPGSFFVQRRSQPSSIQGTSTPLRSNTIDAATAARAISPLAMLQQRPGAFFAPPAVMTGRQTVSKEGHTSGSEENRPSTGDSSSHGHGGNDPFRDPSSTGHSTMSHDPHVVTAFASGDKHERRRSGYTSDTYRKSKSRSRPLSVRDPDSDETQQGIENLYVDRTPRSASSDAVYNVDNAQVPDSAGLEYYLGSNAATPRGTTPISGSTIPPVPYPALPPPAPQNTMSDALYMPATPRSAHHPHCSTDHQQPLVAMHEHEPGLEYAMPYSGLEDGHSAPATAARLEYEPQMEYTYPQPRAIPSSSGVGSTLARPYLHSTAHQDPFNHPAPLPVPLIAATAPSNLSRTTDQHSRGAPSSRQTRRSTVSSDGASSHSSMWRAWEHSNRSWVNDGFETPNDVQDVQLGSNAGAVGGGNSTSIAGYFSWR